ncbi:ABC transporter permease [Amycolatopsis suaedae]|uniref:Transport permease protein n=1 Tax=Amycolatopsis suaedae TaxID=2510978 RepID=A0A4Q7JC49_9PSEU|nr:ABC transporter permease [Amycolatopsis suaedae]RZQ63864.1 ABC transporter permease [Amycolatopsis suaedae]
MTPSTVAVQAGLRRGWIEFRQTAGSPAELISWLFMPVIALVVMYILKDRTIGGTGFSLGTQAVPGILGTNVVLAALLGLSVALTTDRQTGALLRAKVVPNGMLGYVVGKVSGQAALTVATLVVVLVPAVLVFDGLTVDAVTLLWVLVLGLLATLPIGALLGALFRDAQTLGFVTLLVMGLAVISGVFYPVTAMPEWLQWVAQAFPVYWLGLGLRSALLPEAQAVIEIGESWRHLEMIGVLGAWAILGLVLAPIVLRRTTRRATGATVSQ